MGKVPQGAAPHITMEIPWWLMLMPPFCWHGWRKADRTVMAHCHLRQVHQCGDMPRASQRQGKCRGDFETLPTIAATTLLTLCGGQLGSCAAQRHRMCPILRKIKLSLLSETAKPFEGAAVLDARIAWMQGFAMDCKRIFFSSATIVYLSCAPCQLLKGKKNSVWFCRKEYLGWILY